MGLPYLSQSFFEILQLTFFDDEMTIIIQVFHDVVVPLFVVLQDDGLDGGVAFDEYA